MIPGRIYVETLVQADLAELWDLTQRPGAHQRWDLRFHEITYAAPGRDGAQRFRYAIRPLPGLIISGDGITIGERRRPDGTRTSALRFASAHPLSAIGSGAGYWRYIPSGRGVRFVTGYDYEPGLGRVTDLVVRPLMGWATAWSFDRLRLWLETGRTPEQSLRQALLEVFARVAAVLACSASGVPLSITVLAGAAALLVPPLRGTPAARRCLRRPPGGRPAQVPAALTRLENP